MKTLMHIKIGIMLLCASMVLVFAGVSLAQNEPLLGSGQRGDARMLGRANAMRAAASTTSAVYSNPASMSMSRVFHGNIHYQYTGRDMLHNGGLSFVDSLTSDKFAAGVSLDYHRDSLGERDFESWDGRLALSTGIADTFFMGMTGRVLRAALDIKSGSVGPNGEHALPRTDDIHAGGFTMDAGVGAHLGQYVTLGVVGYGLTNTGSVYAPLQLAAATSVNIKEIVSLELDVLTDFTSYDSPFPEIQLCTDFLIKEQFSVRVGYAHDFYFGINKLHGGLGYSGTRFAVDLGYGQEIEFPDRFHLAIGFRFFIA